MRCDRNLKGKVKTVSETSLEGRDHYQGDIDSFDLIGNLVKTIEYDENCPRSVTVWGYIDGKRVSKTGDVTYALGEKPKPKEMELMQILGNPDAPGDKRYDMRKEFEYDAAKRLISETRYGHSNDLFNRLTFSYKDNERDKRDHDSEGNEISRTVEILDKDGNVIEEHSYDAEGKYSVRVMTYEFDAQGNWTTQKTFDVDGKSRKVAWTTFRRITYYP